MTEKVIGSVEEFPEGKGVPVSVDGTEVAVFNLGDEFRAVINNCPHKNLSLHEAGWNELGSTRGDVDSEACTIQCPWHNLEFDLDSGYNPVLGTSLPTFEVDVSDDRDVVLSY